VNEEWMNKDENDVILRYNILGQELKSEEKKTRKYCTIHLRNSFLETDHSIGPST